MEEDIEILECVCRCRKFSGIYSTTEVIFEAIENILNRLEELEKENKELKHLQIGIEKVRDLKVPAKTDFIIVMRENYLPYLKADYIPKSKIEDKIKELEEEYNEKKSKYEMDDYYNYGIAYAIQILKELLEE